MPRSPPTSTLFPYTTLFRSLLDPELYRDNPHDLWTRLRHEEPVYRDEQNGLWALTRHRDVLEAERASDVFSSQGCYRANVDRKSTRLNSSHGYISYAVFCLK